MESAVAAVAHERTWYGELYAQRLASRLATPQLPVTAEDLLERSRALILHEESHHPHAAKWA